MIYVLLVISTMIWGVNVAILKIFFSHVPYFVLTYNKIFFTTIFLFALVLKTKHLRMLKKLDVLLALFCVYFNISFTFLGMGQVATRQIVLMNILTPFITLCIFKTFGLKSYRIDWVASFFYVVIYLIYLNFDIGLNVGFFFLMMSMISSGVGNVILKKHRGFLDEQLLFYEYLVSYIFILCSCFMYRGESLSLLDYMSYDLMIVFLLITCVGYVFIQVVVLSSVKKIGIINAQWITSLNPIVSLLTEKLLSNQFISLRDGIVLGLIFITSFLTFVLKKEK